MVHAVGIKEFQVLGATSKCPMLEACRQSALNFIIITTGKIVFTISGPIYIQCVNRLNFRASLTSDALVLQLKRVVLLIGLHGLACSRFFDGIKL